MQPRVDLGSVIKRNRVVLAVIVVALLFLMFCVRVVNVGQVGIITRFGKVTRQANSGILLKLPWPIEQLNKMNIQIQKEQQDATAATKDLQTVTTTLALNYNLTADTADDVFRTIGTDYKSRIIDPVLQETVKSVTSQYNADELISERPKVEASILKELTDKLDKRGVTVDNVSIVNFGFSDAFNQAIEQKQVAQQDAQKAQYQLQTAQLQAQAQDVQAKTLTPEYLQLQAIQKWDGKMPNYLGSGTVFNIPLSGQ
jgi:regulator of protease activity HflC (stomatin/prohibitin superfamily)